MQLVSRIAGRLAGRDNSSPAATPELDRRLALCALQSPSADGPLGEMVREAWVEGNGISLDDIGYGPTHWEGERFHAAPLPYYYFLAGLVRAQRCRTILEVGTHYGGSCRSMLRGMASGDEPRILTIDVSDLNPQVKQTPGITKLVGDANSEKIIKEAILHFGGRPIDLLYVDADHRFSPTLTSIALYCLLMRPRLVVLDDVLLNPQMRTLWHALTATHGAHAVNCTDLVPDIRDSHVGFGLIRLS